MFCCDGKGNQEHEQVDIAVPKAVIRSSSKEESVDIEKLAADARLITVAPITENIEKLAADTTEATVTLATVDEEKSAAAATVATVASATVDVEKPVAAPVASAEGAAGEKPSTALGQAVAPAAPSVVMVFKKKDGSVTKHIFTRRPIGLDYKKQMPVVVKKLQPGSQASDQAVQPGWTLVALNGEYVELSDFADVSAKIKAASLRLPSTEENGKAPSSANAELHEAQEHSPPLVPKTGTVVMVFKKKNGSVAEHTFTRRPIGLDYRTQMPVVVKKLQPGSQASEQAVQPGWTLVALNGEYVELGDFADVSAKIKAASSTLPEK